MHIVWNHRWEHDKNPEDFFSVLFELHTSHVSFSLSVLGESYGEVPEVRVSIESNDRYSRRLRWF